VSGLDQTVELAGSDSYRAVAEGRVIEVVDGGLVLDRTVFYPVAAASPATPASSAGPGARWRSPTRYEGKVG
jgi:hypothetical protein